jgi:hypothetical protein
MKYYFTLLLMCLASCAWAEAPPASPPASPAPNLQPAQKGNIEIIDGKKFFSLREVRRQQSTTLSPSAIAVMSHPRVDMRIAPANRLVMRPVTGANKPAAPSGNITKEDVLSVFAPEENTSTSPTVNSPFPSTK